MPTPPVLAPRASFLVEVAHACRTADRDDLSKLFGLCEATFWTVDTCQKFYHACVKLHVSKANGLPRLASTNSASRIRCWRLPGESPSGFRAGYAVHRGAEAPPLVLPVIPSLAHGLGAWELKV